MLVVILQRDCAKEFCRLYVKVDSITLREDCNPVGAMNSISFLTDQLIMLSKIS